MSYRILYFRGAVLEEAAEVVTSDLVEVAKIASAQNPHMTAEIWLRDRKVAICRPCWDHRFKREPG
jgi:hypothetical protein